MSIPSKEIGEIGKILQPNNNNGSANTPTASAAPVMHANISSTAPTTIARASAIGAAAAAYPDRKSDKDEKPAATSGATALNSLPPIPPQILKDGDEDSAANSSRHHPYYGSRGWSRNRSGAAAASSDSPRSGTGYYSGSGAAAASSSGHYSYDPYSPDDRSYGPVRAKPTIKGASASAATPRDSKEMRDRNASSVMSDAEIQAFAFATGIPMEQIWEQQQALLNPGKVSQPVSVQPYKSYSDLDTLTHNFDIAVNPVIPNNFDTVATLDFQREVETGAAFNPREGGKQMLAPEDRVALQFLQTTGRGVPKNGFVQPEADMFAAANAENKAMTAARIAASAASVESKNAHIRKCVDAALSAKTDKECFETFLNNIKANPLTSGFFEDEFEYIKFQSAFDAGNIRGYIAEVQENILDLPPGISVFPVNAFGFKPIAAAAKATATAAGSSSSAAAAAAPAVVVAATSKPKAITIQYGLSKFSAKPQLSANTDPKRGAEHLAWCVQDTMNANCQTNGSMQKKFMDNMSMNSATNAMLDNGLRLELLSLGSKDLENLKQFLQELTYVEPLISEPTVNGIGAGAKRNLFNS